MCRDKYAGFCAAAVVTAVPEPFVLFPTPKAAFRSNGMDACGTAGTTGTTGTTGAGTMPTHAATAGARARLAPQETTFSTPVRTVLMPATCRSNFSTLVAISAALVVSCKVSAAAVVPAGAWITRSAIVDPLDNSTPTELAV